jgi:cytochrome c oxidase assembly factor CtaG
LLSSLLDDLPLLLVAVALVLHLAGERRASRMRRRPRDRRARIRAAYFYAGLVTIVVALEGPIDTYSAKLFWVHMVQHVLLLSVAAPLIVLGAPWMSIWRPLPLGFRRGVAGPIARDRWAAPLRGTARALFTPLGAWLAFSITVAAWHLPAAYDLALHHVWVHALEHTTFLVCAILLWAQVIDSPPLRSRLRTDQRAYYMVAAGVVGWGLSLVLAFATTPLYPVYAHVADRPGGISALTDQRLAAGVMLVPGSLTMSIFVFIAFYRWLGRGEPAGAEVLAAAPSTAGDAST